MGRIDFVPCISATKATAQAVHVARSTYRGSPLGPRHVVLVIPEGVDEFRWYECSDRSLSLLRTGMTPEDLDLDRLTDEELDDLEREAMEGLDDGDY
jgi:hypothetical protein